MEKKKLKRMITWSTILVETVLAAIGMAVHIIYDVSYLLVCFCLFPLMLLAMILLSKYFSKGKWKDSMDELERECEEEERREEKKVEKSTFLNFLHSYSASLPSRVLSAYTEPA